MPYIKEPFRTDVEVEHVVYRGARQVIRGVVVDPGTELSCFPAEILDVLGVDRVKRIWFRQSNGTLLERWTGVALVHAAGTLTGDEVVFGEPGDLVLIGARTLEGLHVRFDPVLKRLIDIGPAPAAVIAG